MRHRLMIGVPAALLLAFSTTAGPVAYAQREATLPKDSVLKVKLDDRLSSQTSQRGDRFTATVNGQGAGYDLPNGTRVEGTVTDVQPASSDRPGSLDVDFNALKLPDGETYSIAGTPISLDSNNVEQSSNGGLRAKPGQGNNKMKFLAYGAGAGFVIGSLLGSNIKGALAGGAAGFLYGMLNKNKANGHDVVLNPGTEFGVRMDQDVALASNGGQNYRQGFTGGPSRGAYNRYGYGGNTAVTPAYQATNAVLPADSVLKVKLDNELSSGQNQPGDRFTATLTSDNSGYNLPAGTRVEGVVSQVQHASSNRPGTLDVQFNDLRLPDGQTYRIAGAPISLDSKSVERTSSGMLRARPGQKNNSTKFIAYGAGAGLLIGSLLGSNVEGALAGGAAGYLYGRFHKNKGNGHEVVLKPGTQFGVRLDQPVSLASTYGNGYRRSLSNGYGRNLSNGTGNGRSQPNGYGYGRTTATPAGYGARQVVLPEGSVLKVKLDNGLSSDQNQPGDRFTATLASDNTGYNLPAGTQVEGVVSQVQRASSNQPGALDVQFNDLRLPDGQTYRIAGAPISLDSKSVQQASNGQLVARPEHRNDRTKFIAYGAGAGLLIGSLLGSNVTGGLAGAAAGYLYGQSHKNKGNGHEVVLKPGTEFGVRLDQRVALAAPWQNQYRTRVGG